MQPHMPAPQEEHRKLQALAGNWLGEENMYPFIVGGRYGFRMEFSRDGSQWTAFMDAKYTRA